jgi:HTH-type transcriptional regulator, quorum sensing regulator NprR
MLEGKIIKFYREYRNMKQKELGDGICSSTHISKIERGLTEVSRETIILLAERLEIHLDEEVIQYKRVETLLMDWQETIIKKQQKKAEDIKQQLERIQLLHIPDFYRTYTLVLTRYYLSVSDVKHAENLIEEMGFWTDLTKYEENMVLHIKGIYFGSVKSNFSKALSYLKKIKLEHYANQEYYYDLALTYSYLNSSVLAFYNASKALDFFTKTRSFSRMIDTEMLMLIQLEQSEDLPFLISEYERLIDMTSDFGLHRQRTILYHNLGYLHLQYGRFREASDYYKKAMDARDPSDPQYLGSLEGYLNALTKEGNATLPTLLNLMEEGLNIINNSTDSIFHYLFTMHRYSILGEEEHYYQYLETYAFPYFEKMGYGLTTEYYAVKLFDYFMEKEDPDKANQYAGHILRKIPRKNQFV